MFKPEHVPNHSDDPPIASRWVCRNVQQRNLREGSSCIVVWAIHSVAHTIFTFGYMVGMFWHSWLISQTACMVAWPVILIIVCTILKSFQIWTLTHHHIIKAKDYVSSLFGRAVWAWKLTRMEIPTTCPTSRAGNLRRKLRSVGNAWP